MSHQWLGFLGTGLVIVAYVPQVTHLLRARCAAGVSLWAYLTWSAAAALLLGYAIAARDPVFMVLQAYQLLALASICLLSRRHKGRLCDVHCGRPTSHQPETAFQPRQAIKNPVSPTSSPTSTTPTLVAHTPLHNPNAPATTQSGDDQQDQLRGARDEDGPSYEPERSNDADTDT